MSESSNKVFLGKGLAWPVSASPDKRLKRAAYEESVRQSIWIILSTAKGERAMRPDFGCGIHELVFSPLTASLAGRVTAAVRDALIRFEPRVDVLDVNVRSSQDSAALLIDIDYQVRSTNNVFNLVYPFYLGGSV